MRMAVWKRTRLKWLSVPLAKCVRSSMAPHLSRMRLRSSLRPDWENPLKTVVQSVLAVCARKNIEKHFQNITHSHKLGCFAEKACVRKYSIEQQAYDAHTSVTDRATTWNRFSSKANESEGPDGQWTGVGVFQACQWDLMVSLDLAVTGFGIFWKDRLQHWLRRGHSNDLCYKNLKLAND